MATDYIIGGLMLSAAAVNMLALVAFWASPGLRTTANRFVINLLVVNVLVSIIMVPSLFINGGLRSSFSAAVDPEESRYERFFAPHSISPRHVDDEPVRHHQHSAHHHQRHLSVLPMEIDELEKRRMQIKVEEAQLFREEEKILRRINGLPLTDAGYTRFWGFDVAAALGKHHNTLICLLLKHSSPLSSHLRS